MGRFYARFGKRVLDVALAAVLGMPAGVAVCLCALAVRLESKGAPIFVQERPGLHGRIFKLYKLRSMRVETERAGEPLSDMARMTRVGAFLRKTSLDELPQLWNILKGDMSFIGPRPLLPQYLTLYTPEQLRRHEMRPGLSGWAQVNGRNAITWEEKFALDVWYVEHAGFGLDCRIAWMTLLNVLKRAGVNADAGETMKPFEGTRSA